MLKVLHSRGDINVGIGGGGGDLNLKRHTREVKALCVMRGKNTLFEYFCVIVLALTPCTQSNP